MDKAIRFLAGALAIIACAGSAESAQNPKIDCSKASCPSIMPDLTYDKGISFSSDFLYWETSQTGMWYGQVANFHTSIPNPGGGTNNFFGDYKNLDYNFDPGVRVSLGYKPQDLWQTDLVWTHMNSKASGFSGLSGAFESLVIIPNPLFFVPQILNNNSVNANANWSSNYNTIDLDINREIPLGNYFGLKGHFGLNSLWLNQKYNIFALAAYSSELPDPLTVVNSESNMVQDIWGIGPMVGLDLSWKVYKGFNLFGKSAISLVWSHVNSTVLGQFFNGTEPVVVTNMTSNFHTVLPEIDLMVGGEYNTNFSDNRYHLTLRAGWELVTLYNANFLGASYSSLGNFNMSGLTTGFTFAF